MNCQLQQTACRYSFDSETPLRDLIEPEGPTFGCMTGQPWFSSRSYPTAKVQILGSGRRMFYAPTDDLGATAQHSIVKERGRNRGSRGSVYVQIQSTAQWLIPGSRDGAETISAAPFLCRLQPNSFLEGFR